MIGLIVEFCRHIFIALVENLLGLFAGVEAYEFATSVDNQQLKNLRS